MKTPAGGPLSMPGLVLRRGPLPGPRRGATVRVRGWLLVVAAAGVLLSAACKRAAPAKPPPPRPRLEGIQIEDASVAGDRAGRLDVAAIAGVLRQRLAASGVVEVAAADSGMAVPATGHPPSLRIAGRVGFEATEVGTKGIVRAGVVLRLSTRPSEAPGALNEDLTAAGERPYDVLPGVDRNKLGQELVERTAADLLGGVLARVRLNTAPPAELHAAITADGGTLRADAIRVVGARGLRDEVPTLLALLQHEEEPIRDAALGALIALRERRAVTELTRNRSLRDRHEMRKVLEAIAILGGDEAANYLSFVADSHDDEEIRKLAAEAKGRMDRREAGRSP